jgi:predicted nucleic acid-binding protein
VKILDTDTLTLFFRGHPPVIERHQQQRDQVAVTIISRIETLQGRFAMLLKAADGAHLIRAQLWLDQTVRHLAAIPKVVPIDDSVAMEFDRLRRNKKLIGDCSRAGTHLRHIQANAPFRDARGDDDGIGIHEFSARVRSVVLAVSPKAPAAGRFLDSGRQKKSAARRSASGPADAAITNVKPSPWRLKDYTMPKVP